MTSRTLVLAPGEGLPGRVQASGQPAWIPDVAADANFPRRSDAAAAGLHAGFAIPLAGGGGAMEFLADAVHEPDEELMATLASLGRLAGQFVEHRRAEAAVGESEARKRAMLDAALDAVITIDGGGGSSRSTPPSRRSSATGPRRWSGASWARRSSRPRCASATAPGSRAAPGSCSASGSRSPRCTPTAASSRSS